MAAVHHVTPSNYIMDYSSHGTGALDLSRSKPSQEVYYKDVIPPVTKYERDHLDERSPVHPASPQHGSHSPHMNTSVSPTHFNSGHRYRDSFYIEPHNTIYNTENRSPSLYSADKDHPVSPQSGLSSPNYASCYPGTEHLSPYIIQAAFRQQLLLQNPNKKPAKSESDAVSDAGSEGSHTSTFPIYPMVSSNRDGKVARPFKAYPKDPMSLAAGFSSVDALLDSQSAEKYSVFRKRMLDQICAANGGQATVSNPKMRRTLNGNGNSNNNNWDLSEDGMKGDDSYTERRKKNNAAAKKSRDRRRIKEDEIAIRAAFLERENIELKFELAAARKQLALYSVSAPNS